MRDFSGVKRVVFKVGTSTLTHESGLVNLRRMEKLIKVIADLKNAGKEIVLVSSGAISVGAGKLGLDTRPSDIPSKQAAAAVGQCELMYIYDKLFGEYYHNVAQVLLTRDVVEEPDRKRNVINTFSKLLDWGVIPVVNENDTVATEEIEFGGNFGDNDTLSAIVAEIVGADALVILSDIDGLYTKNPKEDPTATLITRVEKVDDEVFSLAGGSGSNRGTGGMITKLYAARITQQAGIDMYILNGKQPEVLYDFFDGKEIGTLFVGVKS